MTATVVCGIDGTWRSWRPLTFASDLASRAGLRLQVFHATQAVGEPALRSCGERITR
jgi:hypothetical protein